ncbi:hypothetical protein BJV78DRAFT_1362426 [Lactifluus subvellereus]|nr:hypothetical protein BJV78DRAFT_1362426 [Lactifluus subvellereus]
MALDQNIPANCDLTSYHVERSESDLAKVGLRRFEASDYGPPSLHPYEGDGLKYSTGFAQAPGTHFDPGHGPMPGPVHQASPVAPNRGVERFLATTTIFIRR